jgi:regulator of protease activity HflC (stomatin/prohibitin superfamily)
MMNFFKYYDEKNKKVMITKIIAHSFIFLLVIIALLGALLNSFGTVKAGERGVLLTFGAVSKVLGEGLYFKIPFVQSVKIMDIKIQKIARSAEAASKDLQVVNSIVALNFHLDPDSVAKVWREVGADYKEKIIEPAIQETVKASTAKFTAEELITKREQVREDIKSLLKSKLSNRGIVVDEFNIVDFDFSKSFNDAIEAKVVAEQQALAAKNKLEQIKFEAQQAIEAAQGRAKAIQIEGEALRNAPQQIIDLRWIEKWNGQVPTYWGQATPFIGIGR